jgi:enoyl-CoA hydratase/carnithine racemase
MRTVVISGAGRAFCAGVDIETFMALVVLAAAWDLRIAAHDTVFSIPEIDMGIPLGWGGTDRLVREIGPTLTRELIMTGRRFTAQEAKAAGFLNTVVEPEDVHSSALDLAALISTKPRVPIESMKAHVAEIVSGDTSRDDNLSAATEFDHPESVAAREPYVARFIGSP